MSEASSGRDSDQSDLIGARAGGLSGLLSRLAQDGLQTPLVLVLVAAAPLIVVEASTGNSRFSAQCSRHLQSNLELTRPVVSSLRTLIQDLLHQESILGAVASSHSPSTRQATRLLFRKDRPAARR